jgi:hypothetical protein
MFISIQAGEGMVGKMDLGSVREPFEEPPTLLESR